MKSTNLIPCPHMTHTQCWQETPWIETCNCTLHWGECVHLCVHRVYLTFMHTRIFTSLACPAHLLISLSLLLCLQAKPNLPSFFYVILSQGNLFHILPSIRPVSSLLWFWLRLFSFDLAFHIYDLVATMSLGIP